MGKLSPAFIATTAALALASSAVLAQTRITTTQGGTSAAGSTSPSTVTARTTSSGSGAFAGPAATTSPPTETNPNENVGARVPDGGPERVGPDQPSRQPDPRSLTFDADAPFRTTPNNPDATPTGVALGRSPGHTSAGIASGPSSRGIDVTSATLGTDEVTTDLGSVLPEGSLAPGVTVPGIATFTGGAAVGETGVNVDGERVGSGGADFRAGAAVAGDTPTPLFDRVAAIGIAKEQERRARGEEPRVIGLAPRTERDLTHQMPDDPIIRY